MNSIDPSVVRAVFTLADPALAPALVQRLGTELVPALRVMAIVPTALTDAVRASGQAELIAAIEGCEARDARGTRVGRPMPTAAPPLSLPAFAGARPDRAAAEDPVERAARGDLTAAEVDALLDLDDPHVDARLFAGSLLSDAERARLLAGVRRDGTRGPVPGPLTTLLWEAELGRCAAWLVVGMTSGDPEVARVVVNRLPLRTEAGRLRVVVGVWTRYGRTPARRLPAEADFPADSRERIEDAFARRDGLAVLGARLSAEEDPERVVAYLRDGEDQEQRERVDAILADGGDIPWAELLRSHRAAALPDPLHTRLAELPDCPHELSVALLARGLPEQARNERPWLHEALAHGRLSGADLLRYARPAPVVLSILAGTDDRTSPEWWASGAPRAEADALVDEYLGGNAEAWIVALRLFPEFAGTIVELLATARAVAAGRSGSATE
ncbi:hypothetical protein [Embleya scabrispora]|uniref:hypothetical protein n=1 Tax=Embleya scabrispora TaxID=159449 RepID=UPI0003646F04|nr:hypothetical protein [Embleya scabrispora]MYS87581.1 hypothetical protein [Streptomyces sp. SID5474]